MDIIKRFIAWVKSLFTRKSIEKTVPSITKSTEQIEKEQIHQLNQFQSKALAKEEAEWTLIEAWRYVRTHVGHPFPFLCHIILNGEVPSSLGKEMLGRVEKERDSLIAKKTSYTVEGITFQVHSSPLSPLWAPRDIRSRLEFIDRVIQELKGESHE